MKRCIVAAAVSLCLLSPLGLTAYAAQSEPVRVAIIDTGISTIAISPTQVAEGYNYICPEEGTEDKLGHGTAIAGLIAGSESAGLPGACPETLLVPLVYTTKDSAGDTVKGSADTVAQAIYDAVDRYRCQIINISSGAVNGADSLRQAVAYAEECGVLVVSCAGNAGADKPSFPGGYGSVLCVGSANRALTDPADFSSRGEALDLLAPGERLRAPTIAGRAVYCTGTSFSTAIVSAAAARLLAQNTELTPAQLRRILCGSAAEVGEVGFQTDSGWGLLQMDAALEWAAQGRRFRDVTAEQWYFEVVRSISDRGLLGGVSETDFCPDLPLTRAMMWTVLSRLEGVSPVGGERWYSAAQTWSTAQGLTDGTAPEEKITREQLVTILYRYAVSKGMAAAKTGEKNLSDYPDAGSIQPYAVQAMNWAVSTGLLGGADGKLLPQGSATRAQAAAILQRYCQRQP